MVWLPYAAGINIGKTDTPTEAPMVSSGRQTALTEDGQDSIVDEHEMQVQELMDWLQWVCWLGPPCEGAPHPNATVVEDVQTHPSDHTPLISHHDTRARSTLLRRKHPVIDLLGHLTSEVIVEKRRAACRPHVNNCMTRQKGYLPGAGRGLSGVALKHNSLLFKRGNEFV